MEATPRSAAWSAWAGWASAPRERPLLERQRVRLTVHELAEMRVRDIALRDWPRLLPHQVALYTPKQIRHLIRLENALGHVPTSAPDRWRRPDPDSYFRIQDILQNIRLERTSAELPARSSEPLDTSALDADHHWENAARGWAAGAVVLAVLVLLVRALERFLHRKLFKGRRRQSVEWPTPNVLATSHRYGSDIGPPPRLDDSDTFPSDGRESGNDLPPPYSECANNEDNMPLENIDPNKPTSNEDEPPPPYSACFFSNPKDGIPTVHFYNRRNHNQELGQTGEESSNEPSISNVRQTSQESDRIAHVGCEISVSLENNVTQDEETVNNNDNEINDMNAASTQEIKARRGDENSDHVVDIVESHSSQARVVTV